MERLTQKDEENKNMLILRGKYSVGTKADGTTQIWGDAVDKLAAYEDLAEQGRLLELPCAVGDTVYVVFERKNIAEAEVRDFTYFLSHGFCIVVTSNQFNKCNIAFSEFGRTVFFTKEEADKALEGKVE